MFEQQEITIWRINIDKILQTKEVNVFYRATIINGRSNAIKE